MEPKSEKLRIKWIDVAKCIGIFCIYIGHFGEAADKLYGFVFQFHVPLFFFLAGCSESFNGEKSILANLKKKINGIMIPWAVFVVISLLVESLVYNYDVAMWKEQLLLVIKGCTRNTFFAGGLWFLTCLFVMSNVFFVIKKLKKKWIILLICLFAHTITMPESFLCVVEPPKWIWNVDSVLRYLIYYAIGYCFVDVIHKFFENKESIFSRFLLGFFALSSIYIAFSLYLGKDYMHFLLAVPVLKVYYTLIKTLILIWSVLCIARYFEEISLLNEIGQKTLCLCGCEYIVKRIVLFALSIMGIELHVDNGFSVCLYTAFLIFVVCKYLYTPQTVLVKKVQSCLKTTK